MSFAKDDGRTAGIMPLKLGHVAYRVDDVQKIVKFYCDVLGFRVSDWRADDFAFLRCNSDHHTVNFVYDAEPQLHHIAFEVKDWAEIQRAAETLAKHDIHLVWGPGRHIIGHNIAIYHRNADKVRVEFFCEMDQMRDEVARLFRSASVASGPAAISESVGSGNVAQLLGLWVRARHSRLSDHRVKHDPVSAKRGRSVAIVIGVRSTNCPKDSAMSSAEEADDSLEVDECRRIDFDSVSRPCG